MLTPVPVPNPLVHMPKLEGNRKRQPHAEDRNRWAAAPTPPYPPTASHANPPDRPHSQNQCCSPGTSWDCLPRTWRSWLAGMPGTAAERAWRGNLITGSSRRVPHHRQPRHEREKEGREQSASGATHRAAHVHVSRFAVLAESCASVLAGYAVQRIARIDAEALKMGGGGSYSP